jgi:hypothetical protein
MMHVCAQSSQSRRPCRLKEITSGTKRTKMAGMESVKAEFQKKFNEEVQEILDEAAFQPGTLTLNDHLKNGDLEEGIRSTMKLGDLKLFGAPADAPDERGVSEDYAYFYEGKDKEMKPLMALLPEITVTGNAETKPGEWKMLHDCERTRLWAFLRMIAKMKRDASIGNEHARERVEKIMKDLLPNLQVIIASWPLHGNLAETDHSVSLHLNQSFSSPNFLEGCYRAPRCRPRKQKTNCGLNWTEA